MSSFPEYQLYFDKDPVASVDAALPLYPAKEFQSPTRSTVPLLALLKDGNEILKSLLADLGMNADSELRLEFTVELPRGRGKALYTDLMVKQQRRTLAIEAKWMEPRYETVGEWIKRGRSVDNRQNVLRGWLHLLQTHSPTILNPDDFSGAVYQMVHRAASACYNADRPGFAYLHFIPDSSGTGATSAEYQLDIEHLRDLLGNPPGFGFYVIEVELRPTLAFERVKSLPKSSAQTAQRARSALLAGPLFEFTGFSLAYTRGSASA